MFKNYYWVFGLLPFALLVVTSWAGPNISIVTISISILFFCAGGILYLKKESALCHTAFAILLIDTILIAVLNVSSIAVIKEYLGSYRNISIIAGVASILPACLFGLYYFSKSKVIAVVNWIFGVAIGIVFFTLGRALDLKNFGIGLGIGIMIVWLWIIFLSIVVGPGSTKNS